MESDTLNSQHQSYQTLLSQENSQGGDSYISISDVINLEIPGRARSLVIINGIPHAFMRDGAPWPLRDRVAWQGHLLDQCIGPVVIVVIECWFAGLDVCLSEPDEEGDSCADFWESRHGVCLTENWNGGKRLQMKRGCIIEVKKASSYSYARDGLPILTA